MFEMRAKMISVGLLGTAIMLPLDLAKADQLGHASWYSLPANTTANGEKMNPNELTAAHRSLPFGTRVLVENLSNGRSVVVRINDRGPFIGGRIIDLSKAAAASIGMIDTGTAKVRVITSGGGVLAALGEATAKAKDGASKAAMAKVDIAPLKVKSAAYKSKARTAAYGSATMRVAAKASSRNDRLARKYDSRAKVRMASANRRFKGTWAQVRIAGYSKGIRAAAFEASRLSSRHNRMASNDTPYAILGATPGFMKPSRPRRAG